MDFKALAEQVQDRPEAWTDWTPLGDGFDVRAQMLADQESDPFTGTDTHGAIFEAAPAFQTRQRPAGCDGAARKISTAGVTLWWQPPVDVRGNPEGLAAVEKRVRAYLQNDWCYVGLVVEVRCPPCATCGQARVKSASLWGVESDADLAYRATTLGELVDEARAA